MLAVLVASAMLCIGINPKGSLSRSLVRGLHKLMHAVHCMLWLRKLLPAAQSLHRVAALLNAAVVAQGSEQKVSLPRFRLQGLNKRVCTQCLQVPMVDPEIFKFPALEKCLMGSWLQVGFQLEVWHKDVCTAQCQHSSAKQVNSVVLHSCEGPPADLHRSSSRGLRKLLGITQCITTIVALVDSAALGKCSDPKACLPRFLVQVSNMLVCTTNSLHRAMALVASAALHGCTELKTCLPRSRLQVLHKMVRTT
mmetsp:Transcript_13287/g.36446  ORF Transcript_13287/g.36446 Transcript_13287/m.36446 type:complete len:252 (+) Transcript_13287:360-1115(+)